MQRAKDSVGMEQAVRVHLYRTEVPKESRQSRERVTQRWRRSHSREGDVARALGHPSLGKDPYGAQEHTMSLTTRSVKRHAKARQRRRLHAQERLERDRRQAQQAAEALEQALQDLGLPDNVVAELEGRIRSQQKLLGKIVAVMALQNCSCDRTSFGVERMP
jgi:hypothetical protein